MKTYGYMRVSTDDQDFKLQKDALNRYGVDFIFSDKMTGARMDRPGLKRAVKVMRSGDKLVVWKLDRLGRTTMGVLDAVKSMETAGIELVSLTESIDTSTPMGRMFLTICAAFAQMERDLISERTKAGLASYVAAGGKMGKDHFVKDHPARLAKAREIAEIVIARGITGKDFVDLMHEVQPDPPIKSVQSFYNWASAQDGKKRPKVPFDGLVEEVLLENVEIDDEEPNDAD